MIKSTLFITTNTILESETLEDLIKIAGGLKNTTYHKRIQVTRIIPNDKRDELGMDRTIVDVDLNKILNSKENFLLLDGDEIQFTTMT